MCYSKIMNLCLETQWNLLTIRHFCFLEKAIISWLLGNYLLKSLARSCIIWKLLWNKIKLEKEHIEFTKSTALNLENAKTRVAHVTLIHLSWGHTLGYSLCICHGCAVMHLSLILSHWWFQSPASVLPENCEWTGAQKILPSFWGCQLQPAQSPWAYTAHLAWRRGQGNGVCSAQHDNLARKS